MPRKLRIKLITIPWEIEVPTLTLASLAAVTPEEHFEVCIVDLVRERLVLDEPVDLVGISASVPRIRAAYALADFYRRRGVKVVLGGHHATAMPEEALLHADAVVCGEGETSWIRILEQLRSKPSELGGIYHDEAPDLATLPMPRIDLMKLDRYQPFYYPVIASRGCSLACSFCFAKRMTRGYRTYPIRHVLEQVRRRPPWVRGMYFVDDNLAGDLDYTHELFKELRRMQGRTPLPFGMQVRHEFSQDDHNLRAAADAGCLFLSSGFESVNQHSLDGTGKRANASVYKDLVARIQGHGIIASANWMFGFDWDPADLFAQTWDFLRDSGIYHSTFTVEIPFPGTPGYRRYEREGRLLTTDYDQFVGKDRVVHRPLGMTPEALARGIRWLTRKYYSPGHRARLLVAAHQNRALLPSHSAAMRTMLLTFLNFYEVYVWNYRMTPSLRWLYDRVLPFNKHRYVRDLFRGTNFWKQPHPPADPRPVTLATRSHFGERSGEMPPGQARLRVVG